MKMLALLLTFYSGVVMAHGTYTEEGAPLHDARHEVASEYMEAFMVEMIDSDPADFRLAGIFFCDARESTWKKFFRNAFESDLSLGADPKEARAFYDALLHAGKSEADKQCHKHRWRWK